MAAVQPHAVGAITQSLSTQVERSTPNLADLTELLRPYAAQEREVNPASTVVNRANAEPRERGCSRRWASLPEGHYELCGRAQPLTFHHLIPRRNYRRGWFRKHFSKEEMNHRGLMICRLYHRQLLPHVRRAGAWAASQHPRGDPE